MLAALEWTRAEMPKFGGDINQITVFGYSSSGATLIDILASPAIKEDTFARVFISSGLPRLMPHYSRSMNKAVLQYVGVSCFLNGL
jgi:carboxylesterase type B